MKYFIEKLKFVAKLRKRFDLLKKNFIFAKKIITMFSEKAFKIFEESIAQYHIADDVYQSFVNPYPSTDLLNHLLYRKNWSAGYGSKRISCGQWNWWRCRLRLIRIFCLIPWRLLNGKAFL